MLYIGSGRLQLYEGKLSSVGYSCREGSLRLTALWRIHTATSRQNPPWPSLTTRGSVIISSPNSYPSLSFIPDAWTLVLGYDCRSFSIASVETRMLLDFYISSLGFSLRLPRSFHFFAISDITSYNANNVQISFLLTFLDYRNSQSSLSYREFLP
jgi:hypothetical protein